MQHELIYRAWNLTKMVRQLTRRCHHLSTRCQPMSDKGWLQIINPLLRQESVCVMLCLQRLMKIMSCLIWLQRQKKKSSLILLMRCSELHRHWFNLKAWANMTFVLMLLKQPRGPLTLAEKASPLKNTHQSETLCVAILVIAFLISLESTQENLATWLMN